MTVRDNIIITKADKGGAVVIIDVDNYINTAKQQINKRKFYNEIPNDQTELNRKNVNNAIKKLKPARLLNEKIETKLKFKKQKHQRFIYFQKYISQTTQEYQ